MAVPIAAAVAAKGGAAAAATSTATSFPKLMAIGNKNMSMFKKVMERQKEDNEKSLFNRKEIVQNMGNMIGIKGAVAAYAVNKVLDITEKLNLSNANTLFQQAKNNTGEAPTTPNAMLNLINNSHQNLNQQEQIQKRLNNNNRHKHS